MEPFLTRISNHLDTHGPHLRPLFDTMAGEARFAREWLDEDLKKLPAGAALLEVGGGVFLLGCQLAGEGFCVTAIEPTGMGFGEFEELGALVRKLAAEEGATLEVVTCIAEEYVSDQRFDFAFSINVMEHITRPDQAIARVSEVLKPGASYRFFCPNYAFPYEPHFNIPIFVNKEITWKLMDLKIRGTRTMHDPEGVWKSLNWITVPRVKYFAEQNPSLSLTFETKTLVWVLERALKDEGFASRRSPWMIKVIRAITGLGLHKLAGNLPPITQPIMDVRLQKKEA